MPMIIPAPTRLTAGEGEFVLGDATRLHAPDEVAALLRELIGPATGLALADGGRDGEDMISLILVDDPELGAEGYRLSVTPGGVRAAAAAPAGLRWAVQTIRQLLPADVYADGPVAGVEWRMPAVEILDVPRYAWRGCLLDVARWCHPVGFLHRFVDLLAMHKLNTLHLHLTDDQGWRFEVRRYPRLTEIGSVRAESSAGHAREKRFDGVPHGGFYTQGELRDLVAYAAGRGVRVMPEVDLPGHTQAAIAAYPELGNDPSRGLPVRTSWGISKHVLNVADGTVRFMRNVLDELVDVFPFAYVHIGGDEVPPNEWAASPAAGKRAADLGLERVGDLVGWWAGQLADHLAEHGRRAAVWDELLEHGAPAGALVFAWRGEDRVRAALAAGHEVIAAPYTHTYLDWAESDRPDEPLAIAGTLPLDRVYGYRPGPALGVQGQLWSEYLPRPELVEWRAFPRLAALAEVGWSPEPGRIAAFRSRLGEHLCRLGRLGVGYRPPD
jgi:hexosaminidase